MQRIRKLHGIRLYQHADRAGVSPERWWNVEDCGEAPTAAELQQMESALRAMVAPLAKCTHRAAEKALLR
jgi:transcriptional regulator with XRE-family HTH domain